MNEVYVIGKVRRKNEKLKKKNRKTKNSNVLQKGQPGSKRLIESI
jgi:hypothetical protein